METRSSERIRNKVDADETSENLDFMARRGKEKPEGQTAESLKARRRALYGVGIQGSPR